MKSLELKYSCTEPNEVCEVQRSFLFRLNSLQLEVLKLNSSLPTKEKVLYSERTEIFLPHFTNEYQLRETFLENSEEKKQTVKV